MNPYTDNNISNVQPRVFGIAKDLITVVTVTTWTLSPVPANSMPNNSCNFHQYSVNECSTPQINVEKGESLSLFQYSNIYIPRKNYKELYKRISKAKWYNEAYNNMSVGDIISIE